MPHPSGWLNRLRSLAAAGRDWALLTAVSWGDRFVPKRDAIVLRTGTDFDDQGRETLKGLAAAGRRDVTWLVNDRGGAALPDLIADTGCEVLSAWTRRGILAYWRANVVVHTHGVFGARRASRRKQFINLWHGMPIKRLIADSDLGHYQTDLTIATSDLHAQNLAATWGLAPEQVAVVGLPRNDVLMRPLQDDHRALIAKMTEGRPLLVWLPTYRRQGDTVEGTDLGTTAQLPGATPEAINEAMERLGVHALLKAHPMAPQPDKTSLSHLDIWSNRDLGAANLTLYELLAAADYLVTDQSSVWVDYLLTERPMVFALPDLDAYERTRGFYFDSLETLLPGPLVVDMEGLEAEVREMSSGRDRWVGTRQEALELHHANVDAHAARRVARLVVDSGTPVSSGPGQL